jgi:hypothetical protein
MLSRSAVRLGLALAFALSGCGREPPRSLVSQRDSAGIRIVESQAPRWRAGEGWTVDPEPLIDLAESGTEATHAFYRIRDAARLSNGSIVVADGGSNEIRYFSAEGRFRFSVGRGGQGPGEFEFLLSLELLEADSLAAFDRAGRATIIGADGEVTRTVRLPPNTAELHRLHEATFLTLLSYPSVYAYEGGSGMIRQPVPVMRISRTGQPMDTVALAAGFEEFMWVTEDGPSGARPLMGRNSHLAVHDGRIYLGSAELLQFRVLSSSGEVEEIIRAPNFDLSVSSEEIDAERRAYLGDNPPQFYQELVAALPTPDARPAYSDLVVDSEGYVWLGAFEGRVGLRHPLPRAWEVFGPGGEWMGRVRFPARFTVFDIGADYVLGRWYDDLDVEHIQLLRLIRA